MVEMTIQSVRINLATQQRVVILKARNQERYLFIWIAHAEAYAIAVELQGIVSPRPLTHDLLKHMLKGLGAKVARVVVADIVDDIFYTRIILDVNGKELEFDARPSDGFALAVRTKAPVFVEEHVLERVGVSVDDRQNEETVTELSEGPLVSPPTREACNSLQTTRQCQNKTAKMYRQGQYINRGVKDSADPSHRRGSSDIWLR